MDKMSKGAQPPLEKRAIAPVTITVKLVANKINQNGSLCGFQKIEIVSGPKGISSRQPDMRRQDMVQFYIDTSVEGAVKDLKFQTDETSEPKTKLWT